MSRKSKVPAEEKIKLVEQYLKGEISISEAAGIAGVDRCSVLLWVTRYEAEGSTALYPSKTYKVYNTELKEKAVMEYLKGEESQFTICQKFKISNRRRLQDWIRVYNAHGNFRTNKFSGGGSYMKQGCDTTQEERVKIAKYCIKSGHNYGETAKKYNVSYQQARNWTLKYEEQGEVGLEDRRGQRKRNQEPRTEQEKRDIEFACTNIK